MRILHVVPSYHPATRYGGPIYSVHGLCRSLVEQRHDVHVFTTNVDGDADSEVPLGRSVDLDGVQVWYFPSRYMRRLYYAPAMMQELRRQTPAFDLVHLHSVFLWPTWAAARVGRSAGVPYVLSPRGMLVRDLIQRKSRWVKNAWVRLIEVRNIEGAAAIHVTSEKEAAELRKFGFRLPAVWTIANGIEKPKPWSTGTLSSDVHAAVHQGGYVLFLGRINWEKGLDRLLAAWRAVSGTRLIIAGNDEENYLPQLQRIVEENNLQSTVTFLPRHISGADKEALLSSASLFVLPSYSENFGNTVLEAMIRSVPVVVTEEVGAGEVVREVQGGTVVNGAPASLAKGINELIISPKKSKIMGESARRQVMEKYSWEAVASRMAVAYEKMLQSRKR